MLAGTIEDLNNFKMTGPLLLSPKIDGVRGIFKNGQLLSRSLKPLPNKALQHQVKEIYSYFDGLEGVDSEVVVGPANATDCYRRTNSLVMSHDVKVEKVRFLIFDRLGHDPYRERLKTLEKLNKIEYGDISFILLPQKQVSTPDQIIAYHNRYAAKGYEGVMLRCPNAPYKFGRSTLNEKYLLKYKHFSDDECIVIGFEELMTNNNEQERNELGYAKRSSKKENLAGANTLGALVVEYNGLEFRIGTGFTQADRDHIWENRKKYLGKLVKFKYFAVGVKDAPRHPVWLGFRDKKDL